MSALRIRIRFASDGIMGMVGWSVVGHVVFTLALVFLPRVIPRKPPPPILMTAAIVSLPDQGPAGGAPAPKPRTQGPTPEERARQAEEEARKKEEPPEPPPKKKTPPPEKKKPEPRPVKADPTTPAPPGEKKPAEPARPEPEPEPPAAEPAAPLTQGVGLGAGAAGGGEGGIPSITSASFPYQYYRTILVNNIRARWNRPLTPGLREPLRCAVAFVIARNGQVGSVSLSVPSGFPPLDDSAVQAVIDSNPLPPLPYQYSTSSVRAEMIFELTPD